MSIDTTRLKQWIHDNPEKAPSVKIVAALHGISMHTLEKVFHRSEGMTLAAFADDVRLEAVKKLLLTTGMLCFEIALRFTGGREDVLSRWFKHRTGMTMREFREKHGKPGGGAKPNQH